ncbi:MAG: hypothetical protein ACRD50_02940 [Candidatus Acidiferrales bacterium]
MFLGKRFLLVALVAALAAYAVDCMAMTTPETAMECCQSMPCSSHGHSQDCCKTMPAMHAPFVQSASLQGVSFSPIVLAVLPTFKALQGADSSLPMIAAHCHAPPVSDSPAKLPLRI